jgi:divalent metal cation (Fe/Co/Zn/Cd) transporter
MSINRATRNARLSILSNTIFIFMKFTVGLVSGSVSIISEAIHSLMDLAAALMGGRSFAEGVRASENLADRRVVRA